MGKLLIIWSRIFVLYQCKGLGILILITFGMFIFRRYGLPIRDFGTNCSLYTFVCLYTILLYTCMLYTFVNGPKSLFGSPRLLSVLQKKLKRGIYQKISPAGVLEKRFMEFYPTRFNLSTNVVVVFMGDNNDLLDSAWVYDF